MEVRVKRRWLGAFSVFGGIIIAAAVFYACSDYGLEANFFKGTVKGELQINTVVPDTTDEIKVALTKNFPPTSIQELILSGVLQPNRDPNVTSQIVPFEMRAPLGTYEAALVIWKAKDQSYQLTDIVGLYGNIERFELRPVVLTENDQIADSVNIPVDLSRVDRTSSIQGRIDFVGAWPENTLVVALAIIRTLSDLTSGIPPAIAFVPTGATQFDYRLGVTADTYNLLFVAWLPVGELDLSKLKIIGFYEDPNNPGQPGSLTVADKETILGINFVADFANINQ